MGGCQSSSGAAESEGTHTLTHATAHLPNLSDISLFNLKNNNWQAPVCGVKKPYLHPECVSERLSQSSTDLLMLSVLPHGLDLNEWMATNTIAFFQLVTLISSALSELCSSSSCPKATGPGDRVYFWTDESGRKLKCSAPLYTDYALSYIQELLSDEDVFPVRADADFPVGFPFLVEKVCLLMFRTLAHLYCEHYTQLVAMEMHPHLNTVFTHLVLFCQSFNLLEPQETEPLQDLITALTRS
ncbi:MOB kinase activator 2 [Clupea harengus]|uniref:MOB kinase activator 2 n=1 Tax=Clupea harengus TaxID=7950 RepID=A0A6P8EW50_CLUHA|nr:MOB kinase activator 2 [Clupea harengus]